MSQVQPSVWGYLKSRVYGDKSSDLDQLKNGVANCIHGITWDTLHATMNSVLIRCRVG